MSMLDASASSGRQDPGDPGPIGPFQKYHSSRENTS